jgi:hypothetical protein
MKFFLILFIFLAIGIKAIAQFDPEYDDPEENDTTQTEQPQQPKNNEGEDIEYQLSFLERTYVGGNIGLSLGNNFFFFDVSPLAGYDLIPQIWSVGLGATYRYQRWFGGNYDIYGGRVFTRINIGNTFFLHGEYEYLSFIPVSFTSVGERGWGGNVLAGGGIWFGKSDRGGAYLSVLYALTTENGSLYEENPLVISPGFVFYIK